MSEEMEKRREDIQSKKKGIESRTWSDQNLEKEARQRLQEAEEAFEKQFFDEMVPHLAGIDAIFRKNKVITELEEEKKRVSDRKWFLVAYRREAKRLLELAERALEMELLRLVENHIEGVKNIYNRDETARIDYEKRQGRLKAKRTQTELVSQLKEAGMFAIPFRAKFQREGPWWGWLDNYNYTLFWGIKGWLYFVPLFGSFLGRISNYFNRGRRLTLDSPGYQGSPSFFDAVEKLRVMEIPDKRLFVFTREVRAGVDPVLAVQVEEGDQDRYVCVALW